MVPKREQPDATCDQHGDEFNRAIKKQGDGGTANAATTEAQYLIDSDEDSDEEQLLASSANHRHVASMKPKPVHEEIDLVNSEDDF